MTVERQRAAAYVVAFDPQGLVLLTQFEKPGHPRSGAWTLPGGGMEWGEQAHETALRELKEETGLDANIGRLLGVQSAWFDANASDPGHISHALRLVFAADGCAGQLKQDFRDDDTTVAAAWFKVADVARLDRVEVVDFGLGLASSP